MVKCNFIYREIGLPSRYETTRDKDIIKDYSCLRYRYVSRSIRHLSSLFGL